ncbi:MAG: GlsB/YeaQ/YmgE family stress response membrane protein [Hyphomicrobiaceae bacterium]
MDYTPWIIMAVNGLIAGWIASFLLGGRGGLIPNLAIGVIGAMIGGWIVRQGYLKLPFTTGWVYKLPYTTATLDGDQIVVSTIGAIVIIVIARIIAR